MRTFQHRVAAIVTAAVAMKRISGLAEANEVVRRHVERSVVGGNRIRFNGREYKIAPTMKKKVWLVIRRDRFWVVDDDPLKNRCQWPAKLGSYKS